MSQVSEIIVHWTPEDSGRVASMQIHSRIVGQQEWTEQAADADPMAGEFRFTSNAPNTEVEVRARYRMWEGVYGPWFSDSLTTAPAVVEYDTITGRPVKIGDINPDEGEKLDGIEPGATVGAPPGTNVGGRPVEDVIRDIDDHAAAIAATDLRVTQTIADIDEQRDEDNESLNESLAEVRQDVEDARIELATADDAIRQTLVNVNQSLGENEAAIRDEAAARVSDVSSLAGRASTLETRFDGSNNLLTNTGWESGLAGWTAAMPSSVWAVAGITSNEYWPADTYPLVIGQENEAQNDSWLYQSVTVEGGKWYQQSAYVGSHRATARIYIDWYDAANNNLGSHTVSHLNYLAPNRTLGAYHRLFQNVQAPAGATRAQVYVGKGATGPGAGNSYAWILYPQFAESRQGITSALPYSAGADRAQIAAVTSRIADEENARADAVSAVANRATAIESSVNSTGTNSININPNFAAWPAGQSLPTGWNYWSHIGGVARTNAPAFRGGYEVQYNIPGGVDAGLVVGGIELPSGWYVFEVEAYLAHGSWNGAGATVDGVWNLSCGGEADSNGVISNSQIGNRKWTKLFNLQSGNPTFNFHLMNSWSPWGLEAKLIHWKRCAIRQASDAEVKAQKADNDLNRPTTGVIARLKSEETTRATETSALANRATALEASATNSGNLLSNTTFETLDGWVFSYNYANGGRMVKNGAGLPWQIGGAENNLCLHYSPNQGGQTLEALSSPIAVEAGAYYQVYCLTASHRCNAWVSLGFYDQNDAWVGYAGENYAARNGNGGQPLAAHDTTGRMSFQAPANAVRARMMLRQYDVANDGYAWFHRPYVGKVKSNTNQWNEYSPGNNRFDLIRTRSLITDEETARATAVDALARRNNTLEAQMRRETPSDLNNAIGHVDGRVTNEETARAGGDGALATRASNLETRAGNVEARVSTTEGAISGLNGKTAAYWQVEAAAGGNVAKMRAFADNYGSNIAIAADSVFLGNNRTLAVENGRATVTGDLYVGGGKIVMNNGGVMKVQGLGFGTSNQFIEWFGPSLSNINQCSEANASFYLRTDGASYFGGALSAGVLKNAAQTSQTAANAFVTTGLFGSNGRQRTVVVSYTAYGSTPMYGACPVGVGQPQARIQLFRGQDATGALLVDQTFTGTYYCNRGYGQEEPGGAANEINGSFTFNDNAGGTSASYFVRIVSRTGEVGYPMQRLGIVSTEQ